MDTPSVSIDQRMTRRSEQAIGLAREMFDITLSFSRACSRDLDFIIDHFRKQIPKELLAEERENTVAG